VVLELGATKRGRVVDCDARKLRKVETMSAEGLGGRHWQWEGKVALWESVRGRAGAGVRQLGTEYAS
jgi:hypothetical protein